MGKNKVTEGRSSLLVIKKKKKERQQDTTLLEIVTIPIAGHDGVKFVTLLFFIEVI